MRAMRFIRGVLLLMWLLPWIAQTADADTFTAANRAQQGASFEQRAVNPDVQRIPMLSALRDENLLTDNTKDAFIINGSHVQSLGTATALNGELKKIRLTNRLRNLVAGALAVHQLLSDSVMARARAARTLQREAQPGMLPLLQQRLAQESDGDVKFVLAITLTNLQLSSTSPEVRLQTIELLGVSNDPETQTRLQPFTRAEHEPDARVRATADESLNSISHRMKVGDLLGQAFMGLSLGSILLLAALGLAITYRLLGVINMAHDEVLILGAYCIWIVQQLMGQFFPHGLVWYPVIALPVAFLLTVTVGMLLERGVIRHLYGRPLETLLATWDISLMPIRLVRMTSGAQNLEVANLAWLSGGVQAYANLILPWNRIVVLGFAMLVLFFTWLLLNKTCLRLRVRAVTQNHNMAACCGVPTRRVDMLTFGPGSGIAGLGGVALSQLGNIEPELERSYIIDSFLVMILDGIGQLAGSVVVAFGLGIFSKILEPQVGAVLGKIIILVLITLSIQERPQGLFALKGRVID